ncbi:MAG TPA: hypothetical protein VNU68_35340 [Verrucomicrobiae bacterium]|nr:hypothetical protein [Verrucomicrobiae bacterium]
MTDTAKCPMPDDVCADCGHRCAPPKPDNSIHYYNLFMQAKAEVESLRQQLAALDKEWRGGCAMNGSCRVTFLLDQGEAASDKPH